MAINNETDQPFHETFDNGSGALSHHWGNAVDTSIPGQITLTGTSGTMEFPGGPTAGHGYGTYTVDAKLDGSEAGPAVLLWPGDDQWPGQEIDVVEMLGGRQYGTLHWSNGGSDAYESRFFDGVSNGEFHQYQVVWEPGRLTYKVDGAVQGVLTDNVPLDHDAGGINNAISVMNSSDSTSLTVRSVDYQPLGGTGSAEVVQPQPATVDHLVQAPVSDPGLDQPSPAAAAGSPDAPVDWNAIAALVMANYEATGSWHL
ncbi:family 16 glycosylhydrolase [Belnapia sp. T6]|uniref:Family 16 glycosylhydrolase n=1 Tax=Belnapia mucosa TaxID=2804532 RepID=A0ABS1VAL5_9PROT|nr:family 16 glycosylhydrolase [Belnapia mucosa]MBL6458698.1 family 16 glycosylhydrolase [Belnapia mucosa]